MSEKSKKFKKYFAKKIYDYTKYSNLERFSREYDML